MDTYRQLCTEVYELTKPEAPAEEMAFYLQFAARSKGPILEPMCGTGRFLVSLREKGFDIDGSDASLEMIAVCKKKLLEKGLPADISLQYLHEMQVSRRYGLVLIPSGSFGLITDPNQVQQSLNAIREALFPGGKVVLEIELVTSEESSSWPWGGKWWDRADGSTIIMSWLGSYDGGTRISSNIHRYELVERGSLVRSEIERFDMRLYRRDEFSALLADCGFVNIKTWHTFEFKEAQEGCASVVFEGSRD